jgi:DNA-binding MarR family transcriptional regulator
MAARTTAPLPAGQHEIDTMVGMSSDRANAASLLRRRVGRSLRALGSDLDRLDEAVASRARLHRTDLRCLEIVARDGPVSAGHLAVSAGLSTSAVTSVVDRLERAGRMRRVRDSADRRRVMVEVTELARGEGSAAFAGLMEGTQRLLARYSTGELRLIDEFLDAVRTLVTEQAAAQPAPRHPKRTSVPQPAGDPEARGC